MSWQLSKLETDKKVGSVMIKSNLEIEENFKLQNAKDK